MPAGIVRKSHRSWRVSGLTEFKIDAYRQMEVALALMTRVIGAREDLEAGRANTTDEVFEAVRSRLAARRKPRG